MHMTLANLKTGNTMYTQEKKDCDNRNIRNYAVEPGFESKEEKVKFVSGTIPVLQGSSLLTLI